MAKYDVKKIIEHLENKWGGRPCPMCQVGSWQVQDAIFQIMEFNKGALVMGGPVVPLIPVTCNNCGYTVLLNAIITGILVPPSETSPKATEETPK